MKKTPLFILAMSAVALASCSEDEELDARQPVDDAISFRSAMSTRADETTNANLDKIFVTAFEEDSNAKTGGSASSSLFFQDEEFDKGSDTYFYHKAGRAQYYWKNDNEVVDFFAYSPSTTELGADITVKENNSGLQLESFVTPENISEQIDFVTANASGTRKDNGKSGVELTFDHRLAQIEIQAKSESDKYTYKVRGARIGRAQTTGSFDFNTNQWTLDDWHDTAVYTASCSETTLSADPVNIMGTSGNAMLIPQTLRPWDPIGDPDNVAREAYLSVLIQITDKSDGSKYYPFEGDSREFGWVSTPLSGTWEQGKKYIYTLDFTNGAGNVDPDDPQPGTPLSDAIKFSVNVNDWVDSGSAIDMTPIIKNK